MKNLAPQDAAALEAVETREWLESLDYVIKTGDKGRTMRLFDALRARARQSGYRAPFDATTPYINTISVSEQVPHPGNREIERRIKSLVRWNAMAMVVRANRESEGIGGHISTFASSATLYEVGFNHFFRGKDAGRDADIIYFQGHASPGIYSRAFLEGRLSEKALCNFRHELRADGGLSSYPHPWLMPEFWEFPTVSMGLGPLMAIYQARFAKYLENRGLKEASDQKIWAFLGDGETDEPEALGSISLAAREKLDNLIFVINCNLQRLDGPVRGNGQIIQELEANFRGAGWNVIKVLWGSDWDELLARDTDGVLVKRMGEIVDGQYQRYVVEDGAYVRKHFWEADPRLAEMVRHLSDEAIKVMRVGGHDPLKVYNAYRAAVLHKGAPTVILARTIKGYGMGEAGEGKNITHQQKKMNEEDLRTFRDRFGVPIPDDRISDAPFYRPDEKSAEIAYMKERRTSLGGAVPRRVVAAPAIKPAMTGIFDEFAKGTEGRKASTTMVFVKMLAKLLATRRSANSSCRSCRTKRAPSAWSRSSAPSASTPASGSSTSRWTWTRSCTTRKRRTGRSSKRASRKRDRSPRGLPRARRTPRTASTRFRSSSSTRCSASSASATSSGRPPMRAAAASCSAARPDGPRSRVKDCSIRTATATRSR
jgi:pyruvate dehydrogenase E1 component